MNNERGQALLVALLALTAGVLIITPFLSHASSSLTSSRIYGQAINEQYSTNAGVEYAIWHLQSGESEVPEGGELELPEFTINTTTVNVTMENEGGQIYKITSTATSEDGSSTTIESYVTTIPEGFTLVEGDFSLEDGESYTGDIFVEGNVTISEGSGITGDIIAEEDITVADGSEVTGDLIAQGNITIADGAIINGDVCAGEGLIVSGEAIINGDAYVGGDVTMSGGAVIEGDAYVGGDVIISGGAVIEGDYPLPYTGCPLSFLGGVVILTWEIMH